ncbi:MAG TPA: DUF3105 domain-containing protein [Candidatus Fraserbacteria bacterium]|nr:DUF3105 domain-containing protein [Candidatus Fraserbacteria bacterium]
MWRALVGRYGHLVIWVVVVAFLLGGILLFTPSLTFNNKNNANDANSPEQQTAITVEGAKITKGELDAAYNSLVSQAVSFYRQFGQDFRKQLEGTQGAHLKLQLRYQAAYGISGFQFPPSRANNPIALIDALLIRQQAKKRGLSVSRVELDKAFQNDYDQFLRSQKLTEDSFRKILKDATSQQQELIKQALGLQQATVAAFKAKLRHQDETFLLAQKLETAVVGQLHPSDQELLDYLQKHQDQYIKKLISPVVPDDQELKTYLKAHQDKYAPEEVNLSNILIKVAPDAPKSVVQSASEQIGRIKAQLDQGADFAKLAKQYSQDLSKNNGGDLGYLSRDKMDPQIAKVAFKLPVGQVSDPIRTARGFGLIKVTDRRQKKFAAVKSQVKTDYINELEHQRFDHWQSQAQKAGVFPKTVEVRASHILIKVAKDAPADQVQTAYRKIEALQKQLQAGAGFAQLATEKSDDAPATKAKGGDLGWFGHGVMDPAFDQAAFALKKVGDVSPIVRSSFGFHLIELTGRRESDTVKKQVTQAYIKDETKQRFSDWFKQLKSQAKIDYVGAPVLGAFALEARATSAKGDTAKRAALEPAIQAYERIQQNSPSTDPYLGYYLSRLYAQVLKLDQDKQAKLAKQSDKKSAALKAIEQQIALDRRQAAESFLRSAGSADGPAFEAALATSPKNAQLRYRYARWFLQRSKETQALGQLKQALDLDPTLTEAQLLMGDLQAKRFNYRQAIGYYATALKLVQDQKQPEQAKQVQLKLGETYLAWAKLDSASEPDRQNALKSAQDILLKLKEAISSEKESTLEVQLLTDLGDLKMEQGDYQAAQGQYHQALKIGARESVQIKLGQAYLAGKQTDQAQQTFQEVINRDAYASQAYVGLGEVYQAQGKKKDALQQYRDALKRSYSDEARIEVAKRIITLDPQDKDTRLTLADIYLKQHVYQGAEAQYKAVLQQNPNSIQAYRGLGEVYAGRLDWDKAISNFQSALQLKPPTNVRITIDEKILNAAKQRAGFKNKFGPDGQQALYQLADLYAKQGNKAQAKKQLDQLQKDYPDYQPELVTKLADQLSGKKKTATLAPDGKPGQPVADLGQKLLPDCKPVYNSSPPTSGCHSPKLAPWGISAQPLAPELQVHNLAQGGVLLQYRPDIAKQSLSQLTQLVQRLRGQRKYCKLLLAPYPGLNKALALTAWDRLDKLDKYDQAQVSAFIDAFINAQGPEKETACP